MLVDDKQAIFVINVNKSSIPADKYRSLLLKQTELIIFCLLAISDTGIQQSRIMRMFNVRDTYYCIRLATLLRKVDGPNVVCCSFQWNAHHINLEIKTVANLNSSSTSNLRVQALSMSHVDFCYII